MLEFSYGVEWYEEDFDEDDLIDYEANVCLRCEHFKDQACSLETGRGVSPYMVYCYTYLDKA